MGLGFVISPTLSLPALSISKSFLWYFLLHVSYLSSFGLRANGDYASPGWRHRLTYLVIPCFHKLITLSKSLL